MALQEVGEGYPSAVRFRKYERWSLLPYAQRFRRCRQLFPKVKYENAEKSRHQERQYSENGAADLAAILVRLAKRAPQPQAEQQQARHEEQIICPGDVASDGEESEQRNVAQQRQEH